MKIELMCVDKTELPPVANQDVLCFVQLAVHQEHHLPLSTLPLAPPHGHLTLTLTTEQAGAFEVGARYTLDIALAAVPAA